MPDDTTRSGDQSGGAARAVVAPSADLAALVRFAACIAAGSEPSMREAGAACVAARTPVPWVEELLLQSYLFCGFPRTLNAMREWRRVSGVAAPAQDAGGVTRPDGGAGTGSAGLDEWRAAGEATCAVVYGEFYAKLRQNIVALHPALDEWMITEGYGKILSRPAMPLAQRELCIVAACIAGEQERQLHSHLHGALNAGVPAPALRGVLAVLHGVVSADALQRAGLLLERVLGKQ